MSGSRTPRSPSETDATAGTGGGRWAHRVLAAEAAAVVLATVWTVPYLFDANRAGNLVLTILDLSGR